MNDNKVVEGVAVEVVEETKAVEVKENWFAKASGKVKKHGKKIVVGALVATVGVIGYTLGKQAGINSVDANDDNYDSDDQDDDYNSESNTTEF